MIQAFASNRTDQSLYIGSLPGRARCRQNLADAHISQLFSEGIAKDSIAVAQQVAWELGLDRKDPMCARMVMVHVARFVAQLRVGLKKTCDADSSAYGI
jgi:hypothetical protein